MNLKLSVAHWTAVGVVAAVAGLAFGILGLAIGVDYGEYFCTLCEFNGVTGYEATGQVGFIIGAPAGLTSGAWLTYVLLLRRNATRSE